jgi:CRP-like cAMP-binding protein
MKKLFYFFDHIKPLHRSLRKYLLSCLERVEFKKKHVILKEGQIARYIYFIEKGLVRSYKFLDGKERTLYIMPENNLFVSVGSFFFQQPSTETQETLEPCICYRISYDQLQYAYKRYIIFNFHRGVILETYYYYSENRNIMRMMSKEKKYEFLMTNEPWMIGRVPDVFLYSYLGVSKSSFSKDKNRILRQGKKKKE